MTGQRPVEPPRNPAAHKSPRVLGNNPKTRSTGSEGAEIYGATKPCDALN